MANEHLEGHCRYCDKALDGQWSGRGEHAYIKCTCLEQVFETVREFKSHHGLAGLIRAIENLGLEEAFRQRQPIEYRQGDKEKIVEYIRKRIVDIDAIAKPEGAR